MVRRILAVAVVWTAVLAGGVAEAAEACERQYPPRSGYDRDEYPPAMSEEGGYGASVRYIDPADNRGAGSVMGNQLEDWCEEQPFRISFEP